MNTLTITNVDISWQSIATSPDGISDSYDIPRLPYVCFGCLCIKWTRFAGVIFENQTLGTGKYKQSKPIMIKKKTTDKHQCGLTFRCWDGLTQLNLLCTRLVASVRTRARGGGGMCLVARCLRDADGLKCKQTNVVWFSTLSSSWPLDFTLKIDC